MTDKEIMKDLLASLKDFQRIMGRSFFVREIEQLENAIARHVTCERCGEVNPAEIHTCSPQREWKYNPMTGEPLVDGWPLYSGLPKRE